MRSVIVICGGWSVSQYDVQDLRKRGYVVGVNESAVLFECDVGISMDRLWLENRYRQYFTTRDGDLWAREGAAKNLPHHPRLRKFTCDHKSNEMSPELGVLNGTNSGMVALNWVYQIFPTPGSQVYVFGLDMQKGPNGEPYHHAPYDWPKAKPEGNTTKGKYKEWQPQFYKVRDAFAKRGIKLQQVNNRSMVKSIPSISYEQFLKETSRD